MHLSSHSFTQTPSSCFLVLWCIGTCVTSRVGKINSVIWIICILHNHSLVIFTTDGLCGLQWALKDQCSNRRESKLKIFDLTLGVPLRNRFTIEHWAIRLSARYLMGLPCKMLDFPGTRRGVSGNSPNYSYSSLSPSHIFPLSIWRMKTHLMKQLISSPPSHHADWRVTWTFSNPLSGMYGSALCICWPCWLVALTLII